MKYVILNVGAQAALECARRLLGDSHSGSPTNVVYGTDVEAVAPEQFREMVRTLPGCYYEQLDPRNKMKLTLLLGKVKPDALVFCKADTSLDVKVLQDACRMCKVELKGI